MNTKLKWGWEIRQDLEGLEGVKVRSLEVQTPGVLISLDPERTLEVVPFSCRVFAQCTDQGLISDEMADEIESRAHSLLFRKAMEQVAVIFHFK